MHKDLRKAFTMIELIFVIIILGILAVTALPRFVGIQDDARISAEQGVAGAVRGGIAITHSKWLISGAYDVDGDSTNEVFSTQGYLENLEAGTAFAASTTAVSDGVFQKILTEEAEDWTRTKTVTDGTNGNYAVYNGPASGTNGVASTADSADINTTGAWKYNTKTGQFSYVLESGL